MVYDGEIVSIAINISVRDNFLDFLLAKDNKQSNSEHRTTLLEAKEIRPESPFLQVMQIHPYTSLKFQTKRFSLTLCLFLIPFSYNNTSLPGSQFEMD